MQDVQDGRVLTRAEYQDRFPGHEELVGKLHDKALQGSLTRADGANALGGESDGAPADEETPIKPAQSAPYRW